MYSNDEDDPTQCDIIGPLSFVVQFIMGFLAFLVLIFKRTFEHPKRDWKIWALDTSKQLISAGLAHVLNVLLAIVLSQSELSSDSCAWYLITIILDTTLGIFSCCALLMAVHALCDKYKFDRCKSGNYFKEVLMDKDVQVVGDNEKYEVQHILIDIDYFAWSIQLIIWCTIVFIGKTVLFLLQKSLEETFDIIGVILLRSVEYNGVFKLIIVMAIAPLTLNAIQFWIQDNFLKKREFSEKDQIAISAYFGDEIDAVRKSVVKTPKDIQVYKLDWKNDLLPNVNLARSLNLSPIHNTAANQETNKINISMVTSKYFKRRHSEPQNFPMS